MDEVGGEEWLRELGSRLASRSVDPDVRLVVQHTITNPGPRTWHVVVADGRLTVVPGPHQAPDVTLSSDAGTAAAIADGSRSARREFLDGRLRIGGDIVAMIAARGVLAAIT